MNPSTDSPTHTASPAAGSRGRWTKRQLIRLVVVYVGVCLVIGFLQRQLMYVPRRGPVTLDQAGELTPHIREVSLTSHDGLPLHGWLCLAEANSPIGLSQPLTQMEHEDRLLVLMFAGNAGNRASRLSQLALFRGLGCDALLVDYRGYGDNAGTPSEKSFHADARAIWDHITLDWQVPAERIVISGESLGGGVAVRLASDLSRAGQSPAALVLRATFTSMVDAASHNYPWLPIHWLLIDRYESLPQMSTIDCPLLVYHGQYDRVVPLGQGQRLFAAAPERSRSGVPRRFLEIPDADHNNIFQLGRPAITQALAELFQAIRPGS